MPTFTLTRKHRDSLSRSIRYARRRILFPYAPTGYNVHVRNVQCLIAALKAEGVERQTARAYCEAIDAAR